MSSQLWKTIIFFKCSYPIGNKTRNLLSQLSAALNGQFSAQMIGFALSFSRYVLFGVFSGCIDVM